MFVLGPSDNQLNITKSDMIDTDFGGHREYVTNSNQEDYTRSSNSQVDMKTSPDDAVMDVDALANSMEGKNEFSYQDVLSDCQKGNEANFMVNSDHDNRPIQDTGSDAAIVPNSTPPKRHRKPNQWMFTTKSEYEGELS